MNLESMIATVEVYIHIRTDKEVKINHAQFNNGVSIMLLHQAYSIASSWLAQNNI